MDWASIPFAIAEASISPGVAGPWTVRSVSGFFAGIGVSFFSAAFLAEVTGWGRVDAKGGDFQAQLTAVRVLGAPDADEQHLGMKAPGIHGLRAGDLSE